MWPHACCTAVGDTRTRTAQEVRPAGSRDHRHPSRRHSRDLERGRHRSGTRDCEARRASRQDAGGRTQATGGDRHLWQSLGHHRPGRARPAPLAGRAARADWKRSLPDCARAAVFDSAAGARYPRSPDTEGTGRSPNGTHSMPSRPFSGLPACLATSHPKNEPSSCSKPAAVEARDAAVIYRGRGGPG